MVSELEQKLIARYHLEKQLLDLEARLRQLEEDLPRCKYRLRQARIALTEYEAFGIRSLLDKVRGTWEEKRETLQREVRAAETHLEAHKRQLDQTQQQREGLLSRLEPLLALGDVVEAAGQMEEGQARRVLDLEARLCAEKLRPILEENLRTLELAQQWARPHNQPEAFAGQTLATLLSQADTWAKRAMTLLERLAACGILLDIHPYFTNPTGYIAGVTRFNQLDRINYALDAIEEALGQTKGLLLRLPEAE